MDSCTSHLLRPWQSMIVSKFGSPDFAPLTSQARERPGKASQNWLLAAFLNSLLWASSRYNCPTGNAGWTRLSDGNRQVTRCSKADSSLVSLQAPTYPKSMSELVHAAQGLSKSVWNGRPRDHLDRRISERACRKKRACFRFERKTLSRVYVVFAIALSLARGRDAGRSLGICIHCS